MYVPVLSLDIFGESATEARSCSRPKDLRALTAQKFFLTSDASPKSMNFGIGTNNIEVEVIDYSVLWLESRLESVPVSLKVRSTPDLALDFERQARLR
jgi:hypothetical protein